MGMVGDTGPEAVGGPTRIGPFEILGLLGEGGMGRVYRARQNEPLREVALKVMAGATLSQEFARRFQREIELLATLEHPGIARLYQAGQAETPTGPVPYLAMEYVRGEDLLTHARSKGLDLPQKLRLIATLCRAVHYAHTRGVIHRDLKPGNILVDEHGEPRILDFGVAHVSGDEGQTQMTRAGEVLGTLPYMPLEQLGGRGVGVDPRWDVYALGVIAYQLISGELPYPGLSGATVLSALQEVLASAPVRLSRRVPEAAGDIETIVMKAMSAEAAQRYSSAAEFAADIERVIERRPIEARPPTVRYVLGLFVRRHRALSAAVGGMLLAILVGAGVALRLAYAESQARQKAEQRAAEANAVSEFVERMIASADPEQDLGNVLTVRQLVKSAQADLGAEQDLPPLVAARLERLLGRTLSSLGESEAAIAALENAVRTSCEVGGDESSDCLETRIERGRALRDKGLYERAESELRSVLSVLGPAPDGEALRLRLSAQHVLGQALVENGRLEPARALMKQTYDESVATLGATDPQTLGIGHDQGEVLSQAGQHADAIALLEAVAAGRTQLLGPLHPRTLDSRNTLAGALFRSGDAARAEPALREVAALREKVLGAEHIATITARQNVAVSLIQLGKAKEGLPLAEAVLPATRAYFGADHRRTLTLMNIVAYAQEDLGRIPEAEKTYREILAVVDGRGDSDHAEYLAIRNNLAMLLGKSGRRADARSVFEETRRRATRTLAPEHPYQGIFAGNYGEFLLDAGQPAQALPLLEASLLAAERDFGAEHARTLKARDRLARAQRSLGRGS